MLDKKMRLETHRQERNRIETLLQKAGQENN